MLHTVSDAPADAALRDAALTALAEGEVVALPTETVYGLAVRADDPTALDRLTRAKGRPSELRFTRVVADGAILDEVSELEPLVRRLASRYWPGPLTLVVRSNSQANALLAPDGWVGLRMPAHGATLDLIRHADFPIALTSANRHDEAPAVDAAKVRETFGDEVAVVWDGGPSRLGEASGVLQLGRGVFEPLREGLIDLATLRREAGLRLVFVCTGNTCRSPMAEGLARALLEERLGGPLDAFGFEIGSMGVFASPGSPASPDAVVELAERGIDLSAHRSSPLLEGALAEADEVLCLTRSHAHALLSVLPPRHSDKVDLLDPDGRDVPDPIGSGPEAYHAAATSIEAALRVRLDDWA